MTSIDTYDSIVPHPVGPYENRARRMSASFTRVGISQARFSMIDVGFSAGKLVPGN